MTEGEDGAKSSQTDPELQQHSQGPTNLERRRYSQDETVSARRRWGKAVINRQLDEHSYELETASGILQQNRIHLRKLNKDPPTNETTKNDITPTTGEKEPAMIEVETE